MLDERQLEMRVGAGIAVPGEVLSARRQALGLQRPMMVAAKASHFVGPFGEGAIANHGFLGSCERPGPVRNRG
jgi:hypothetical protein